MGNVILIRAYNVGCGDCFFYVRIPNKRGGFHILIDCGTKRPRGTAAQEGDRSLARARVARREGQRNQAP